MQKRRCTFLCRVLGYSKNTFRLANLNLAQGRRVGREHRKEACEYHCTSAVVELGGFCPLQISSQSQSTRPGPAIFPVLRGEDFLPTELEEREGGTSALETRRLLQPDKSRKLAQKKWANRRNAATPLFRPKVGPHSRSGFHNPLLVLRANARPPTSSLSPGCIRSRRRRKCGFGEGRSMRGGWQAAGKPDGRVARPHHTEASAYREGP